MPSPFPGMDPYLEDPRRWPDVHTELISGIRAFLNERLLPKYYATIEERVYISDEYDPGRRVLVPDVRLLQKSSAGTLDHLHGGNAAAVAEPIEAITLIEEEIREPRVEIIDAEGQAVVAVIEVLSPTNKIHGSAGRESYERKRLDVMKSSSHFIEIDLLRDGEGFSPYEALPPHEYRVHVSRTQRRPRGLLWAIRIEQQLPPIKVPLRDGDPDASLDLQVVLSTAYDRAAYGSILNYRAAPVPPLPPEQAQWAESLLREKGLR
ncbi:MAG: hypothetical protein JWL69_3866 [Phycisphaerales bacterium]|nr:hypothetical protein [Phycisphaerales bacterium]MDB5354152.1 hypothetical protein [Phycisphaerales bacterium]